MNEVSIIAFVVVTSPLDGFFNRKKLCVYKKKKKKQKNKKKYERNFDNGQNEGEADAEMENFHWSIELLMHTAHNICVVFKSQLLLKTCLAQYTCLENE